MATQALRRRNVHTRSTRALAPASNDLRRTQSVPRTDFGRLSQNIIQKKVKAALKKHPEGVIACAADCPKDTAQSWKLGRRAPNTAYILTMARGIDEIGMLLAEEADLGRFYGHDERIKKRLQQIALQENAEGQFARSLLREIGA